METVIGGPDRRPPEGGPIRVLAVDGDPALLRFLEMFLGGDGYEVRPAYTGDEGVRTAREWGPDVVLLDQWLTDPDAADVVRSLRSDERTQGIPVILLTSRSAPEGRIKNLRGEVDDTVGKPFDIGELRTRLTSVVSRRREQAHATEVEKLKTLRKVVASVPHEVNNPLAAILMSAEALEHRHGGDPDVLSRSRMIQENALRIRDILKRLERVRSVVPKPYVAGERILELGEEDGEP